ncbi:MAG: CoA pyrophosphatase [Pseudomonadota bacterium]
MAALSSTGRINARGPMGDQSYVDAAVLIPLVEREKGFDVLLTRRAAHLKHHPGQVSFPGGRKETGDASLDITALRETHEETGISPDFIELVGHLPRMYTISAYDVHPVVGRVRTGFALDPDPAEVDSVFFVPLAFFLEPDNRLEADVTYQGTTVRMAEWHYDGERVWGATAAMLLVLINILNTATDGAG